MTVAAESQVKIQEIIVTIGENKRPMEAKRCNSYRYRREHSCVPPAIPNMHTVPDIVARPAPMSNEEMCLYPGRVSA